MNAISWQNQDPGSRHREALERALDISGAGAVLLQTTISRVLQHATNRTLGAVSTLGRKSGSGDAWRSNYRTAANTGGEWVSDTDSGTQSEGGYTQQPFTYRTMIGRVKITRKLQATGRSWGDVVASELLGKLDDMMETLETTIFTGNTAANANQPNGLLTLIGNVSGQTVANTTANAGELIYLDRFDEAIQKVKGHAMKSSLRIYASQKGNRFLNAALRSKQQINDTVEVDAGFRVKSYDGIPIVQSTGLPDTLVWNGTAARVTAFTGGTSSALVIVNTEYVFMVELTPLTTMPLDRVSSQYNEVDIFTDLTIVLDNPKGGVVFGGLSGAA